MISQENHGASSGTPLGTIPYSASEFTHTPEENGGMTKTPHPPQHTETVPPTDLSRRTCLTVMATAMGTAVAAPMEPLQANSPPNNNPFRYCLNTSTIRGQKLPLVEEIELAARVGYQGIEPWIREIEQYRSTGGSLKDLKNRIADLGLKVESAIGFPTWCVNDEAQRKKGQETFRHDADLVRQLGGTRIAAPPVGAHRADSPDLDLFAVAERYAQLLEIGRELGVTPMVEIWGPSKNLSRLGEAVFVAVESGHPDACILPDIYHIYRGGSDFSGLKLLSGKSIPAFHVNDYPTHRPRTELTDADRVHVGDGKAPTNDIFRLLADNGCQAALSLELFNRDYWKQDAEHVARTGLEKLKAAVRNALEAP